MKEKYDGWIKSYYFKGKFYPSLYSLKRTRRELIRYHDLNVPHPRYEWKKQRRKGRIKAVKVRLVEVDSP